MKKMLFVTHAEYATSELVFGSPVPGLPKDRDWTGPGPIRTENF